MKRFAIYAFLLTLAFCGFALAKPPKQTYCYQYPTYCTRALPRVWCIQFPMSDDGLSPPVDCFYALDRYEDGQSPCVDGPFSEYGWYTCGRTFPEGCPTCTVEDPRDKKKHIPQKAKIKPDDDIADLMVKTKTWDPTAGVRTILTKWVLVEPEIAGSDPIPVKVFVAEVNLIACGAPVALSQGKRVRTIVLGFEAERLPDSEKNPQKVKPTVDQDNKHKGTFKLGAHQKPITFISNSPLKN